MYPVIDMNLCINCGKCEKTWPVLESLEKESKLKKAYSAKNEVIRRNSTSGDIFTVLAEEIINSSGVVCVETFGDIFKVKHIVVKNKEVFRKRR